MENRLKFYDDKSFEDIQETSKRFSKFIKDVKEKVLESFVYSNKKLYNNLLRIGWFMSDDLMPKKLSDWFDKNEFEMINNELSNYYKRNLKKIEKRLFIIFLKDKKSFQKYLNLIITMILNYQFQ